MVIITGPADVALFVAITVLWFWQPAPASYRSMRKFYKYHSNRGRGWLALNSNLHEIGWPLWLALLVFAYFLYFQEMTEATSDHGYYVAQFSLMLFGAFLLKWWPALVFYKHEYTLAWFVGLFAVFTAIVAAVLFGTDSNYRSTDLTRYLFSLILMSVYAAWLALNLISTMNWWDPLQDEWFIRSFDWGRSGTVYGEEGYGPPSYGGPEEGMYGPQT